MGSFHHSFSLFEQHPISSTFAICFTHSNTSLFPFLLVSFLYNLLRALFPQHARSAVLPTTSLTQSQLNASIHHALPNITQRAVRDFGAKMVSESKHELMEHFTTEALDEVADLIIARASDTFLDKCLEKRLLTIEAKPLINALAKAERLGYEPGDIVQDDQHERVIPQEAYPGAGAGAAPNGSHIHANQPPPAVPHPSQGQLQCMKCFRTFVHAAACDYVSNACVLTESCTDSA